MTREEIDRYAKLLRELRSVEVEVRAAITDAEGSLNTAMLIAKTHRLSGTQHTVVLETTTVPRFDQKNFKLIYPELYQQYTAPLTMRRLIIT